MELADICLTNLRKHYSTSRVILVSDGDPNKSWESLAEKYRCEYTEGERLYLMENGGKMLQRGLGLFLNKPTDYLIKIDTDTVVRRKLKLFPDKNFPLLFGSVITSNGHNTIQGGCVGHTLAAAKLLYESNVLCDDSLKDVDTYVPIYHHRDGRDIIFEDWLRGYCANKIGIEMIDHPEICSRWDKSGSVILPNGDFAITHPNPVKAAGIKVVESPLTDAQSFSEPRDLKIKLTEILNENIQFNEAHYVSWCDHQNPGDHVIATAGAMYLKDRNIKVIDVSSNEMVGFDGRPIISQGGGNLGDLFPCHEDFRCELIKCNPKSPIVIMPQSVLFNSLSMAEKSREAYNSHDNLTILIREQESFSIAKSMFDKCNVILCPDTAWYLCDFVKEIMSNLFGEEECLIRDNELDTLMN